MKCDRCKRAIHRGWSTICFKLGYEIVCRECLDELMRASGSDSDWTRDVALDREGER